MQTAPDDVRSPDGPGPDSLDDLEQHVVRPTATHEVSIEESDDGATEITVPISSTSEHRSGGVMTELALEDMADQLREGTVGLWDDHGLDEAGWREYRREDMYGWWVEATIEDDVLWATARLRSGDPRSEDLVDQLDQGMPIGFSVGYIALKDEWVEQEDGEQRQIIRVDLMECSPVGIPDNREAVANAGVEICSALADAGVDPTPEIMSTLTDSITDTITQMSNTENDAPEEANEADEEDDEETENRNAEEAAMAAVGIFQSHMEAAIEDVEEWLDENADYDKDKDEEESAGADAGDDEDDEDASSDGDDDEDDDEESNSEAASAPVAELRSEIDDVRSENEELRAKVDRLESENRETEGRKGIVTTDDAGPEDSNDNDNSDNERPPQRSSGSALDEARLLAGDN